VINYFYLINFLLKSLNDSIIFNEWINLKYFEYLKYLDKFIDSIPYNCFNVQDIMDFKKQVWWFTIYKICQYSSISIWYYLWVDYIKGIIIYFKRQVIYFSIFFHVLIFNLIIFILNYLDVLFFIILLSYSQINPSLQN
jgi:hypothetical protein